MFSLGGRGCLERTQRQRAETSKEWRRYWILIAGKTAVWGSHSIGVKQLARPQIRPVHYSMPNNGYPRNIIRTGQTHSNPPQSIPPAPSDLPHRNFPCESFVPVFNSPQEIFIPWLCPISPQTHIAFFVLQCPDGKEYHSLNYMLPKKYFLLLGLNLPSPLFTWSVSVYLKLPLHRKSNRTTPLSLALQAWQVKAGRYAKEMERMGVNGGTIRWGGYQTAVKKSICEPQCSCHPDNNRLQAHALLCLTSSCNRAPKTCWAKSLLPSWDLCLFMASTTQKIRRMGDLKWFVQINS